MRNPLSLKKLVHLDGEKAVLYRSKMNPRLGRNFEAMDPLEWLARLGDHIPDPGGHRTFGVGRRQSLGALERELQDLADRQDSLAHALAQRSALEQLAEQIGRAVLAADVVYGQDAAVVERARRTGLALESAQPLGGPGRGRPAGS